MSTLSTVLGLVAGTGAGTIATEIALSHIPAKSGIIAKTCCYAGAIGIGWAASSVANAAVQTNVTKIENFVKSVMNNDTSDGFVQFTDWEEV